MTRERWNGIHQESTVYAVIWMGEKQRGKNPTVTTVINGLSTEVPARTAEARNVRARTRQYPKGTEGYGLHGTRRGDGPPGGPGCHELDV